MLNILFGTPDAYIIRHSKILRLVALWMQYAELGYVPGVMNWYFMNYLISTLLLNLNGVGVSTKTKMLFWFAIGSLINLRFTPAGHDGPGGLGVGVGGWGGRLTLVHWFIIHLHPGSTRHRLHPSPRTLFPSSHCSLSLTIISPQMGWGRVHLLGPDPEQVDPGYILHRDEQPSLF